MQNFLWDIAGVALSVVGFGGAKLAANGARALGPLAVKIASNCVGTALGSGGIVVGLSDCYYNEPHQPGIGN